MTYREVIVQRLQIRNQKETKFHDIIVTSKKKKKRAFSI